MRSKAFARPQKWRDHRPTNLQLPPWAARDPKLPKAVRSLHRSQMPDVASREGLEEKAPPWLRTLGSEERLIGLLLSTKNEAKTFFLLLVGTAPVTWQLRWLALAPPARAGPPAPHPTHRSPQVPLIKADFVQEGRKAGKRRALVWRQVGAGSVLGAHGAIRAALE